jgi:hypothetical protein
VTYLVNISQEEADQGHPPLTSIVVSKTNGRPGDGYLPAMIEVGFAHEGEKLDDVWGRAVAAVHTFWRKQSDGPGEETASSQKNASSVGPASS